MTEIFKIINQFSVTLADFAWGWPLIFLLMGGGLYLFILSHALPLKGFFHAIRLIFGIDKEKGKHLKGQLSHFKSFSNAIAATVGMGNIGGVALAVSTGGPGAIFWMWVSAIIGMNTKFFECTLAVMFRGKDYMGEVQGGPMYVIKEALPKKYHWLAYAFAIFGLLGCMALFNINQLTDFVESEYSIERYWVGIICSGLVAYILLGGIQRIASVSAALVPTMCVLYVFGCLYIIFLKWEMLPYVFEKIFNEAFSFNSASGAAIGLTFKEIMITGVRRAAFSNEAGIGTAPMAHSNAKTNEPISEGLVAMIGPFLDTIVICTMTAIVILVTFPDRIYSGPEGVKLTIEVFKENIPIWGEHLLGISVLLFSFTTMIGMANYNQKCWNFLFMGKRGLGNFTFIGFFSLSLMFGALFPLHTVINLLDAGLGFMAYPNMIATIILAPKIITELKRYFHKQH